MLIVTFSKNMQNSIYISILLDDQFIELYLFSI